MTMQYALMSHGELLGYTGAAFPSAEVPAGVSIWHFVPTAAFDVVEPIVAELTAPPALALVDGVIPTRDASLHPARNEHEAQMERLKKLQIKTGLKLDALLPSILDKAFNGAL